ncbi:hypothetical protein [Ornithinimicrobium kibberense]|uniref:hypothetical protein n=1 Tax=Ornithinimicrobium kibberense TaxID=282060 RepID=UPI00361CAA30
MAAKIAGNSPENWWSTRERTATSRSASGGGTQLASPSRTVSTTTAATASSLRSK